MARTALTVVGAVVGAYFGYPQLGMAVGSIVGNAVDPEILQGPRIGETGVQTSAEGAPRAIVYGTASVTGNIIQSGRLVKGDVISGGKGGEPKTSNEICIRTYAIRICEGPIGGVLRIWEDDKLVYDVRDGSAMLAESAKWLFGCNIYLGHEDQMPDPFLMSQAGPEPFGLAPDTPAYRGTAYMVFVGRDLTDRRGSIPQYRFEVAGSTRATEVLSPLVIGSWTTSGRPVHEDDGEMLYRVGLIGYDDYDDAVTAATVGAGGAGLYSNTFIAYNTSLYSTPSVFSGGASVAGNPKTVTYQMAAAIPDIWDSTYLPSPHVCANLISNSANPDDGILYGIYIPASPWIAASKLFSYDARPLSGPYSYVYNNCTNYSPSGGGFPVASGSQVLLIEAERMPSVPEGYTKIVGIAKQLTEVEYRAGSLYQNALGPVLLPGDPNYDSDDFWQAARDAAVLAGRMHADLPSWPAVVSAYAIGTATIAGEPVELGVIVADIHQRCDISPEEYDVSELSDSVAGLVLAGDYSGGDAIDSLRSTYFFDKAEYDKKLWFPKRGKAVVGTLTIDDLTEIPDLSRREQTLEFPKKMHLQFQHAASGYVTVKATSARSSQDARVVGEVMSQTPVVLNEDQAAQTVAKMHKVAWTEADGEFKLTVPESMLAIVPSDCLGISLRGVVNRYRVEKQQHEAGMLKWTLRRDRQSAYVSAVTGIPIPDPTPPPPTIVGDTVLVVADISPRQDSEDDLNYLVAVTGANPAWYGAVVQRSLDGGATYTQAARITTAARIGELLNVVPDADEHTTDTTNTVQIRLYRDTQQLDSITDAEFLSEGGAFLLENADGTWEVMQYRDAVTDSAGDITLSMLHRGRLNSGTSSHAIGAKFVMLEDMTHVVAQSAWIGQTLTHRAPSFEQSVELAAEQDMVYAGNSQIEWPVASLTMSRVADVVDAFWAPRHRLGTEDAPVASINFQGYRITITGTGTITFDQTADSFSQDVSSIGGAVTVSVQALNRITGAGPATSGTI
jgi:hypothetical protein